MLQLIFARYHVPNNCNHEMKEFKDCGEGQVVGMTKEECLLKLMTNNHKDSCWRYVPMRFEEIRIN